MDESDSRYEGRGPMAAHERDAFPTYGACHARAPEPQRVRRPPARVVCGLLSVAAAASYWASRSGPVLASHHRSEARPLDLANRGEEEHRHHSRHDADSAAGSFAPTPATDTSRRHWRHDQAHAPTAAPNSALRHWRHDQAHAPTAAPNSALRHWRHDQAHQPTAPPRVSPPADTPPPTAAGLAGVALGSSPTTMPTAAASPSATSTPTLSPTPGPSLDGPSPTAEPSPAPSRDGQQTGALFSPSAAPTRASGTPRPTTHPVHHPTARPSPSAESARPPTASPSLAQDGSPLELPPRPTAPRSAPPPDGPLATTSPTPVPTPRREHHRRHHGRHSNRENATSVSAHPGIDDDPANWSPPSSCDPAVGGCNPALDPEGGLLANQTQDGPDPPPHDPRPPLGSDPSIRWFY